MKAAVAFGLAIGALLFGGFFLLNAAGLQSANGVRSEVARAFANGALVAYDFPRGNTEIGSHQYNDCLILGMAMDWRAPPRELAISPVHGFINPDNVICGELREMAASGVEDRPRTFYHNYVHGQVALARALIGTVGVSGARMIYKMMLSVIIVLGIALSLWGLAKGLPTAFWAVFFLVFTHWFGLGAFAQSLGHGPADAVFLGFALFMLIGALNGGLSDRSMIIGAGVFGALTAIFEMLTGGIPLGAALLIGGSLFASRRRGWDIPAKAVASFCAAVGACFAAKVAAVVSVFGWSALTEVATQLGIRIAGGVPANAVAADAGLLSWGKSIAAGMGSLIPGLPSIGVMTLQIAVVAGVWGLLNLLHTEERARAILLAGSNAVIVGWLIVFWQHTVIHAWFMDRMFAWTVASGLALFVLALRERRAIAALEF